MSDLLLVAAPLTVTFRYLWVMMFHNEDFPQSELKEEKKAEIVNFRRETINKMMKLGVRFLRC